ncbi:hypothetical protein [Mycobacterium kansasii]|uniref:hypothetical protein n=1 Tax=Mycobacterium kansasii TaxID=1768 RepID=UPI00358DBEAC
MNVLGSAAAVRIEQDAHLPSLPVERARTQRVTERATPEALNEHLKAQFAKWQLPDEYAYIVEVPKTSVGKFDKKELRKLLSDGQLPGRQPVRSERERAAAKGLRQDLIGKPCGAT